MLARWLAVGAARELGVGGNARLRGCALRRVATGPLPGADRPSCWRSRPVAYVAGNLSGRRLARYEASSVLVVLALLLAVTNGLFGLIRTDPLLSTAFLSAAGFLSGGRTLVASTFALSAPPALRPTVMRLRASTMQFGSFLGSIAGGLALAVGGFRACSAPTMGVVLFGAAADARAPAPASQRCAHAARTALALSGA